MPKMWLFRVYSSLVMVLAVTINNAGTKPSCPTGKYGIVSSHGELIICKSCSFLSKCPPGMGMSTLVRCGDIIHENTKLRCVHCISGKNFSSTFDNSMCQACRSTTCKPNEAFDGECTVIPSLDTTQCNGKCAKGYHTKTDSVDDCTPCAKCYGPKAKRVQKCIDDNQPRERQCEAIAGSPSPTIVTEQHKVVSTAAGKRADEDKEKSNAGYKAYGHPAMFGTFLVVISVLVTYLLIMWKKKCSKRKTSQSQVESQHVHTAGHQLQNYSVSPAVLEEVNHNDVTDSSVKLPPASTILKKQRANSLIVGPVKRKVSFTRQHSISTSAKSEEREALVPRSAISVPTNSVAAEHSVRKRSLSSISYSGSTGKKGQRASISRQNSNPGSTNENENEAAMDGIRKSETFSSFSNILGPKGTAEELEPIMPPDSNDDDMPHSQGEIDLIVLDPMTKKPSQLNAAVYSDVCLKLNQEIEGKDWRKLAGHMGYDGEFIKNLKLKKDPADALLSHWQTKFGNDVKKLIDYLKEMERSDVIELLFQP